MPPFAVPQAYDGLRGLGVDFVAAAQLLGLYHPVPVITRRKMEGFSAHGIGPKLKDFRSKVGA
jgi:hypothetical protein